MKKITALLAATLFFSYFLSAQVSKTVNVPEGTRLASLMTAAELSTVTDLTVTGTIDARDFKTMRDNMPVLASINLSGSNIVAYEGMEGTSWNFQNLANIIPDNAFDYRFNLRSIDLPSTTISIGSYAFRFCSLFSINLPPMVTTIGDVAFAGCPLRFINLPSSVTTIGNYAFDGCYYLFSIDIPSSVNSIGEYAFNSCQFSISVEPGNKKYSSLDGVLFNKTKTALLLYPRSKFGTYVIPSSVTSIGSSAFMGCYGLLSVKIPELVTSIGSNSFSNCNSLTTIIATSGNPIDLNSTYDVFGGINKSVCKLFVPFGSESFYKKANQWSEFTITEMPEFKLSANKATIQAQGGTGNLTLTTGLSWDAQSDQGWLSIDAPLGQGNQTITYTATANSSVTSRRAIITFSSPETTTQIIITQEGMLKSLTVTPGLLSSTIQDFDPSTIERLVLTGTIDARDFKTMRDNMPMLTMLDISGVIIKDYIGSGGPYYNSSIYRANEIPINAFYNQNIGEGKSNLTSVYLPNSIISIGSSAFQNCTGLTSFIIPISVISIGSSAFQSCTGLTTINIPPSVSSIGSSAFQSCKGLTTINIPPSVTSIGSSAFQSCTGLTTINIPPSVSSIGSSTFQSCTGLTKIYISSSVNSIGSYAFGGCSSLSAIYAGSL